MGFARRVVFGAVSAYWQQLQRASGRIRPLPRPPLDIDLSSLPEEAGELAENIGDAAAKLDAMDAGYAIGALYTATMPVGFRSQNGAYYTPPALCEVLLDMAAEAGVDWRTARILDPACGGGAFLSPVARRMARSLRDCEPRIALKNIEQRLLGFELDPFAAWLSQVFLEAALADLYHEAGTRPDSVVRVCDSLEQAVGSEGFDLVVGNPPYGRIGLSPELREKFRRSLFGHANLYGVFTDLALRFARPGGVVAYVTPTSFLAGEYFKALRGLLGREAPPVSIGFVAERKGVFADVLQETLLATYKRGGTSRTGKVYFISPGRDGSVATRAAGSFNLPEDPGRPWLMPRTEAQSALLRQVDEMPCRLADYGYTVSTGPLVWNRHKTSLRDRPGTGRYPLIWAEAVRPDGVFSFRAEKRNHKPYFEPKAKERWVVTEFPCVLLQRTTAKEQCRRLIAAELPASFLAEHGAVVIENHLNMIKPLNGTPKVALAALAVLFNSDVVDQVFRCINGSVAVSAYELEALPLPLPEDVGEIERLVNERANRATLERAVERLYSRGTG
ncbi:MAG: N-6 DNA methylase [Rhodospirillaceae bacterium]|nr:N-6 DNA methylase [Rhodospirillaceae bacterium]MYB14477.1 N-6 DNA methylase [Rhodospirillaceae bacterium]MYI50587.1 N-6 DNA methylase [Rhodospirillaceae bacterium]